MPRPVTIRKGRILAAALATLRREGAEGLSARAIATEMGCSTQPIYTAFSNMAELEQALLVEARAFFLERLLLRKAGEGAYEAIGLRLLSFSRDEPRLFRWIMQSGRLYLDFESERRSPEFEAVLKRMAEDAELAGLDEGALARINRALWFFTYGLAVSLADGVVAVSRPLVRRYLNEAARSLILGERTRLAEAAYR